MVVKYFYGTFLLFCPLFPLNNYYVEPGGSFDTKEVLDSADKPDDSKRIHNLWRWVQTASDFGLDALCSA